MKKLYPFVVMLLSLISKCCEIFWQKQVIGAEKAGDLEGKVYGGLKCYCVATWFTARTSVEMNSVTILME